ncbi:hypothetical protein HJG60_010490 [Phyllostomus discolor]|uniref:Uncharacterized protein n=1 Tax=Phyllostomus discolor TaxID=89673 RepID=A0A834ARZ8_9CHIR|nr:hypothetical protein HJG60_010490 [Phyllostomus discolor]
MKRQGWWHFFGKDNHAGKNIRQQEKRKTKYEMNWLHKRSCRQESAELRGGHGGRCSFTGQSEAEASSAAGWTPSAVLLWNSPALSMFSLSFRPINIHFSSTLFMLYKKLLDFCLRCSLCFLRLSFW